MWHVTERLFAATFVILYPKYRRWEIVSNASYPHFDFAQCLRHHEKKKILSDARDRVDGSVLAAVSVTLLALVEPAEVFALTLVEKLLQRRVLPGLFR